MVEQQLFVDCLNLYALIAHLRQSDIEYFQFLFYIFVRLFWTKLPLILKQYL